MEITDRNMRNQRFCLCPFLTSILYKLIPSLTTVVFWNASHSHVLHKIFLIFDIDSRQVYSKKINVVVKFKLFHSALVASVYMQIYLTGQGRNKDALYMNDHQRKDASIETNSSNHNKGTCMKSCSANDNHGIETFLKCATDHGGQIKHWLRIHLHWSREN